MRALVGLVDGISCAKNRVEVEVRKKCKRAEEAQSMRKGEDFSCRVQNQQNKKGRGQRTGQHDGSWTE